MPIFLIALFGEKKLHHFDIVVSCQWLIQFSWREFTWFASCADWLTYVYYTFWMYKIRKLGAQINVRYSSKSSRESEFGWSQQINQFCLVSIWFALLLFSALLCMRFVSSFVCACVCEKAIKEAPIHAHESQKCLKQSNILRL